MNSKQFIFILFVLITQLCLAQIGGKVIDSLTGVAIPYVNIWIENEELGVTSNEEGKFYFKNLDSNKVVIFSAIGYRSKKIELFNTGNVVKLSPIAYKLQEVLIQPMKQTKELIIGEKLKKSMKLDILFGCGGIPWISARYFKYETHYSEYGFLKKIKLITDNNLKKAKLNIRLYKAGEDGGPGDYLYDENIYVFAKVARRVAEVDLTDYNIKFPREGLFVAVEWLIIEENRHEFTARIYDTNKFIDDVSYEPSVGVVQKETNNSWLFSGGKWSQYHSVLEDKGKFNHIAIELTLSN